MSVTIYHNPECGTSRNTPCLTVRAAIGRVIDEHGQRVQHG